MTEMVSASNLFFVESRIRFSDNTTLRRQGLW